MEDNSGILFVEDEKKDLCSFKSVRKVHKVNRHEGKAQLMAAYRNGGWMSPEMANVITHVINDFKSVRSFNIWLQDQGFHFLEPHLSMKSSHSILRSLEPSIYCGFLFKVYSRKTHHKQKKQIPLSKS